nr:hypothetical protein [uncultured Flavobacterium sp.]
MPDFDKKFKALREKREADLLSKKKKSTKHADISTNNTPEENINNLFVETFSHEAKDSVDPMSEKLDTKGMSYGGNEESVNQELKNRISERNMGPGHEFREDQYVDPNSRSPAYLENDRQENLMYFGGGVMLTVVVFIIVKRLLK